MYEGNEEHRATPDQLTRTISMLFIAYGCVGGLILAISYSTNLYWLSSIFFVILGLAFFLFPTDNSKTILGIIGMISSFYASVLWAGFTDNLLWTWMTLFSVVMLGISFAAVCHVTCTWPNLDYD
ncbi:MAG: hypothetical protein ACFFEV_05945 [Candidatus Thorarchaeota archaeon]